MKKWLIIGLEPEIEKMSLENLVMPRSKEVLKKKKKTHNNGGMPEGHQSQLKELSWPTLEQSEQENK